MYFIAFKQQEAHFSQFSGPSFFLSVSIPERIENTKSKGSKGLSCHDLQVDERARECECNELRRKFRKFEFFSTLWHGTAAYLCDDIIQSPFFHNFQNHLSFLFFFTRARGSKGLSRHDLQVDRGGEGRKFRAI